MPIVPMRFLILSFYACFLLLVACSRHHGETFKPDFFGVNTFISLLEYDLSKLEEEIQSMAVYTEGLFDRQHELLANGDKSLYRIEGVAANSEPGATLGKSSLYVSKIVNDPREVEDLILITNPLDSVFSEALKKFPVVSQVYFNSPKQLSRLYPPYNVNEMLEPNLDVTTFNFYYEADEDHNPERRPVWVDAMYVDPVGRGWMITLTCPVYHEDELKLVLGMDITLNEIIENYVSRTNHQLLIVDKFGTLVAGKSKTIELFSLPTLKNHTYTQTITSDSFRKEDYNLFKSRSQEVRRIANEIVNTGKSEVLMDTGRNKVKVVGKRMGKLDWFVLEVLG